ncbi:MAG TPA: protein phosphatase 2C domain-containing protein [Cellulomonas sp.]
MRTSWGSATDRGSVREVNEDALLTFPPVFLVADGMGGYDAGDLASRIAIEEFANLAGALVVGVDDVHACFARAGERMRAEFTGGRQGGTTVAGVVLTELDREAYWLVFNVGDSRVYRLTDAGLEQVSVDHSVAQELAEAGVIRADQVAVHPDRHILTRALGTGQPPEPDYWMLPAGGRDRLLLCTDGLVRELSDEDVASVLAGYADPQDAADRLVERAVLHGGRDNVSVVVVDVAPIAALAGEGTLTAPRGGAR